MEKDSPKAPSPRATAKTAAPRREVAAPKPRATAQPATPSALKRSGIAARSVKANEPKSVKRNVKGDLKGGLGEEGVARARPRTRLRQPDEPRAQMLERLSNPLISLHEASVLLQVCAATVRRLSNEGELPHKRTEGGQRRFHLSDVLRLSDEREKRRASSGRASARVQARPHASPASAQAEGLARAREQERLQEVRAEQARAREGRERLAATQARAEQARLAAQKQPSAPAPPTAPSAKPGTAPGEAPRPANLLRLGIPRALVPRASADAAPKPKPPEGDE